MTEAERLLAEIAAGARYDDVIRRERERLLEVAAGLYDAACELALRGPWAAWDREQPAGAELEVTPAMLRETGDPNIRALVRIASQLSRAAGQLEV